MSIDNIYDAVLNGRAPVAAEQTRAALEAGHTADEILNKACMAAMAEVGRQLGGLPEEGVGNQITFVSLFAAHAGTTAVQVVVGGADDIVGQIVHVSRYGLGHQRLNHGIGLDGVIAG